jgi:hypothetical protein
MISKVPGVGEYEMDHLSIFKMLMKSRNKKGVIGKTKKNKTGKSWDEENTPGPGHYQVLKTEEEHLLEFKGYTIGDGLRPELNKIDETPGPGAYFVVYDDDDELERRFKMNIRRGK